MKLRARLRCPLGRAPGLFPVGGAGSDPTGFASYDVDLLICKPVKHGNRVFPPLISYARTSELPEREFAQSEQGRDGAMIVRSSILLWLVRFVRSE